jgi:hypothetical protein
MPLSLPSELPGRCRADPRSRVRITAPGGRSTTAFAAGLVGCPGARFRWYTALGVLLWAVEASLLGYLGGELFESRPVLGLAVARSGAPAGVRVGWGASSMPGVLSSGA